MKSNSHSPVTEMLSGKYKVWLIAGLTVLLVADFTVCVYLWACGISGYWQVPFFLMLVDVLYLLGVIFSNQRFAYAKGLFIVYAIVTCALTAAFVLANFITDKRMVFSTLSAAVWSLLHVIGIIAAIVCYIYAARRIRGGKTVQALIAIAAVGLVAVITAICGIFLFRDGYFGQGSGVRALIYTYDSDGETCKVVGVVDGNAQNVVVPDEFNGKKVTSVSGEVFAANGVKTVTLECDENTTFVDSKYYRKISSKLVVYADKSCADVFKQAFYAESGFALGNKIVPIGLGENEVCITFDYDEDAYEQAKGEVIPTWYGKKGDKFTLDHVSDIEYVAKSDIRSDSDLYWNYLQNDERIMSALKYKDYAILNAPINESCYNVGVSFQNIYKIIPGDSNDNMYITADRFDYAVVDSKILDYKLAVAATADELLEPFNDREDVFSLTWTYQDGESWRSFTSLTALLSNMSAGKEVTIRPIWSMDRPIVELKLSSDLDKITYGDSLTFSTDVKYELENIDIHYMWRKSVTGSADEYITLDNDSAALEYSIFPYVGDMEYQVSAIVTAPQITSLNSLMTVVVNFNSKKRQVSVNWTDADDLVYNGEFKVFTAALTNAVVGDDVYLSHTEFSYVNAGSHQNTVSLQGKDIAYYELKNNSHIMTVKPRPVVVTWENWIETIEYDGNSHMPTAHATDIDGKDLEVTVAGSGTNVGTYKTTAQIVDGNYAIDTQNSSDSVEFTITPCEVDISWSNTTLTYNGQAQAPTPTALGVDGTPLKLNVSGAQTNTSSALYVEYTATASLAADTVNANYRLSDDTKSTEFTIAQCPIEVTWTNTALVYNGRAQAPTPSAIGVDGKALALTVTGQQTNAGEGYVAQAKPPVDLSQTLISNYVITVGDSQTYSIAPYTVQLTWGSTTLTYNGQAQAPTVTARGVNNATVAVTVTGQGVSAGSDYVATASLSNGNYQIQSGAEVKAFTIQPRNITISWANTVLTYNGGAQAPSPSVGNAIGDVQVSVSGAITNVGSGTATATVSDPNHRISAGATCSFRIEPKSVSVVWSNTVLTYNGKLQSPSASAKGVDGSELNITVSGSNKNVGNYTATAALGAAETNYTLSNKTCAYGIGAKSLTVAVDPCSIDYGDTPEFTYTATGLLSGDEIEVTFRYDYTPDEDGNIPDGQYIVTATVSGADIGNYAVTVVDGKLTVAQL